MPVGGAEDARRGGCCLHIVVEQPGQGRLPVLVAVLRRRQLGGVGAEQVVHLEPAWPGWLDQVRPRQRLQQVACLLGGGAEQRGGVVAVQAGAGMQARQPERPGGWCAELLAGPGEHYPHGGARVLASVQQVESAPPVRQVGDEAGERRGRPGVGELSRHPQGQRQIAALTGQGRDRGRVGGGSVADQRAQQVGCLRLRQQVKVQPGGAVAGNQPGQCVAAGHHRHARRAPREQRAYLVGRAGVVQQHQHPPAGDQASVPGGPLLRVGGDVLSCHPQGPQESGHRVVGCHRAVRVEAAQVHVQLPVGELVSHLMRPVHGQRGLADPRRSADRGDDYRARVWLAGTIQ